MFETFIHPTFLKKKTFFQKNKSHKNVARDDEDMEAAAEKAALERGKRLSKRGTNERIRPDAPGKVEILLMAEISNNHLGGMKPYK